MIKVFSTYTRDYIYNKKNKLISVKKGGPAFFIEKVFKKNKVNHKIISKKADISIKVINGLEKGVLKNNLKEDKISKILKCDTLMISTVDKEWILKNKVSPEINIFLDAQGYVRGGRKNKVIYKLDFWNEIFCMKCNEQELNEIPDEIIENQKRKILIITKGSNSLVAYIKGKKHIFNIKKMKPRDAIGAGDTLFASFVSCFTKTNDATKSINIAIKETSNFLSKKV